MEAEKTGNVTENIEQNEIEKLFSGLNFKLMERNLKVQNSKGEIIGEIDLVYHFEDGDIIFIIEVTRLKTNLHEKVDHFFSRWSDRENLSYLFRQTKLPIKKTHRIFVDFLQLSESGIPASLKRHFERSKSNSETSRNHYLFKDDIEYFIDTQTKVGVVARNDLLSYLEIERRREFQPIDAIQFYVGDHPAFAFAAKVNTLLESCYVFRRRKRDAGYQRALNLNRISSISRDINQNKILAYPNSIVVSSQTTITEKKHYKEDCPKPIEIRLPTSYCELKVIDGQHRLLGFAHADELKKETYLSVIAFEQLPLQEEMKIFIDINSKQKKVDRNLVLLLKADFNWDPADKEYSEKISVKIAEQLNTREPLRNRIYFGTATDKPGGKVTLATLVSALLKNNLVGGKFHLFQSDIDDIKTPVTQINRILSTIKQKLNEDFFLGNLGLRIMFRLIQIVERNKRANVVSVEYEDIFGDLVPIITGDYIKKLQDFYGEGGANKAADEIISSLKKKYTKYIPLEQNLIKLRYR